MTAGIASTGARWLRPHRMVRQWKLWQIPRPAVLMILGVEIIAVAAFAASLPNLKLSEQGVTRWLVLAGLSVLHAETAARAERMRRYLSTSVHVTMISVWAFAAVLCLPTTLAATLVAFLFAFASWQQRGQRSAVPHREIYNASTAILAALAANTSYLALMHHLPPLTSNGRTAIAALAALVIYLGLNIVLIITTVHFAVGPVPVRELLPDREEIALELGTLVLGILTAETIIVQPWLTPLVLVVMVLLQRSSLVSQLELAAATDAKTGLLNAAAWQELAQRELIRSQHSRSPCAVMLLDLDHFKTVNDTLGHLAGDSALRSIGEALQRELRGYDAVARFGGEEFVVFLHDVGQQDAIDVAERTLSRIRNLAIGGQEPDGQQVPLTASIGLASYPTHGEDLTDLLEAADVALYGAKRAGRDRVGLPPDPAAVAQPT
ncbi:MAG TPA: GGDEF domain-containing protein [Jatrophihabitans sp.]|nr:GGDEF domain-containing protein [Jatrophihabitans sp.]